MLQLSKRLKAVADMIHPGNVLVDVGTDHGYLPIYALEQDLCPRAYAMDVREGPLGRARENIARYELNDKILCKLSDGLAAYEPPEEQLEESQAFSLSIAGMGGGLMVRILEAYPEKTHSFQELILEPQSDVFKVRYYLRTQGFTIVDEDFLEEDGKYYPIIKAVRSHETDSAGPFEELAKSRESEMASAEGDSREVAYTIEDYYGPVLLRKHLPDYMRFLNKERNQYIEIFKQLNGNQEERIQEVDEILIRNARAIDIVSLWGLPLSIMK